MGSFIVLTIVVTAALTSFVRPWVGIVCYYLLALLGPQYVWWWDFNNLPVSYYIAAPTLAGFMIQLLRGRCDFSFFRSRLNLMAFLLWCCILVSFCFGPFVSGENHLFCRELLVRATKIYFFYLCSTLLIDNVEKLFCLCMVLVVTAVFYVYWANMQYFNGNWAQFNMGRLMGPNSVGGGGIYGDENGFAMLFVTSVPFIYYLATIVVKSGLRYPLLGLVPLGWHAVFLTGSRGGLLGLSAVTAVTLLQVKRKMMLFLLLPLFVTFYFWQAGNTMKQRSETIAEYHGESSAETRLEAWKSGVLMLRDHPITGVGVGAFMAAFPNYSNFKPHMAHNTIVQFAAESGVGAALCYLSIIFLFFKQAKRNRRQLATVKPGSLAQRLSYISNSSTTSFAGLVVCSFFLSLNYFEVFFYLLIINNAMTRILSRRNTDVIRTSSQSLSTCATS